MTPSRISRAERILIALTDSWKKTIPARKISSI
jgi:hypothetical protein